LAKFEQVLINVHACDRCQNVQEFVKAVIAYQKRVASATKLPKPLKLDHQLEKKRKVIVRSFSLARDIYCAGNGINPSKESDLKVGADFLEVIN